MDELIAQFTQESTAFLRVVRNIQGFAMNYGGTVYLPKEMVQGYVEACNDIIVACCWLSLPPERVEVKLHKVEYVHGKHVTEDSAYTAATTE